MTAPGGWEAVTWRQGNRRGDGHAGQGPRRPSRRREDRRSVLPLIGGSNRSIALQPVRVQGMTGLNVAAGIGEMTLHHED